MSSNPQLDFEVHRYKAIRERLMIEDTNIDEQTLADTTEGLTDLHELLAAIVRGALEDETLAGMLKVRMSEMADRLERFQHRAEKRRQLVRDVMLETDVKKLQMPDFTASLRNAPPHVVVIDENLIPETFWENRPHLRKRELLDALKDGAQVEGAALSNPGMSLSVRTR
jgi:hypothetical protein